MCLSAAVESLADSLQCPTRNVWAQFIAVDAMHMGTRPVRFTGHCPIVTVQAQRGYPDAQLREALTALANSVSIALDLPIEDVRVQWNLPVAGPTFAGGTICASEPAQ
jgi:hypothetical protein